MQTQGLDLDDGGDKRGFGHCQTKSFFCQKPGGANPPGMGPPFPKKSECYYKNRKASHINNPTTSDRIAFEQKLIPSSCTHARRTFSSLNISHVELQFFTPSINEKPSIMALVDFTNFKSSPARMSRMSLPTRHESNALSLATLPHLGTITTAR